MTPKRWRRLYLVGGIVAGVAVATALALSAFRQNVELYFIPSDLAAGKVHGDRAFRLGGMVTKGSVQRAPGSLDVRFTVTDFCHDVPVTYSRVLPDLFREGQGVVVHGRLDRGVLVADDVLAKHDEKYMPPKIHDATAAQGAVAPAGAQPCVPPTMAANSQGAS
jgi:cytochrome c-type biogenesis protein CcmE